MATQRDIHLRQINDLYGIPNGTYDNAVGRRLLIDVIEELGARALTDDAIELLAMSHLQEDARVAAKADADYRRSLRR
jgi:hypothetical protein